MCGFLRFSEHDKKRYIYVKFELIMRSRSKYKKRYKSDTKAIHNRYSRHKKDSQNGQILLNNVHLYCDH